MGEFVCRLEADSTTKDYSLNLATLDLETRKIRYGDQRARMGSRS